MLREPRTEACSLVKSTFLQLPHLLKFNLRLNESKPDAEHLHSKLIGGTLYFLKAAVDRIGDIVFGNGVYFRRFGFHSLFSR